MLDDAPQLLDAAVLADLQSVLGDGLRKVLTTSVEHFTSTLDECSAHVAAGDLGALRTVAHRLKGGASSLGAIQLMTSARRLELVCMAGNLSDAQERVAVLLRVGHRTIAALRERCRT
jgi:HPt (histidine-containing phosphotransfer) domain-containing protein